MTLYSTNNKKYLTSFREAVLKGLAPDGGLFMPSVLPVLPSQIWAEMRGKKLSEISYDVARVLLHEDVPDEILRGMIDEAINFDAPLICLDESTYVLELFHGPTLAFKDFAARFMARLMEYFVKDSPRELTILVATSGDTGSAVAHGFLNVPGIRVYILYPSGAVSQTQEKMLTTMEGNITALEIKGTFDDCQKLVKEAFIDRELSETFFLSSANSINIARLIPQMFYYAYAWTQLPATNAPIVISVPSGNFGNLTAGLMIKRMGLPVSKFVAACNANDVVSEYLRNGEYVSHPSRKTLSNAMDVGNPSNFARMLELYDHNADTMRKDVWSMGCTDDQTRQMIKEAHTQYGYVLDPHGAVGYFGLKQYHAAHPEPSVGIFFETAHPAKFPETVEETLEKQVEIPQRLRQYLDKEKNAVLLASDFSQFKNFLLSRKSATNRD